MLKGKERRNSGGLRPPNPPATTTNQPGGLRPPKPPPNRALRPIASGTNYGARLPLPPPRIRRSGFRAGGTTSSAPPLRRGRAIAKSFFATSASSLYAPGAHPRGCAPPSALHSLPPPPRPPPPRGASPAGSAPF